MEEIQAILKQFTALDAALYGSVPVLAVLLRFGRAYWRWFDDPHTLGAGVLLGLLGAVLGLTASHHAWQFIVGQALSLGVAVLLAERVLRGMAGKLYLPRDNEYADKKGE